MTEYYTLSEVAARTGAKVRPLQAWTDGGVIQTTSDTDRAGRGVHRLYKPAEVRIAAVVLQVANLGVTIGHLRSFAATIRPPTEYASGIKNPPGLAGYETVMTSCFERAIQGEGENFLCCAWGTDFLSVWANTDERVKPAKIVPSADFPDVLKEKDDANCFLVIDLTSILHSLI